MGKPIKLRVAKRMAARFCRIKDVEQLAEWLDIPTYQLKLMAAKPHYHVFSIPKKDGSKRWIEDPEDKLQRAQAQINFALGTVFYFRKSAAAYGFMLGVRDDPAPRNIVTNARQHLGNAWLFNADLEDFFHQVKAERVYRLFSEAPFRFKPELADLLTRLATHQGRLPMGAPTSPVLSNFATLELDERLLQLAEWAGWTYTRYADDLAFSGDRPFTEQDISRIRELVEDAGFSFNEEKFKLMGPDSRKEITGVQLGEKDVEVPDGFLEELRGELQRLQHVLEVANRMGRQEPWIGRFEQQVEGKVNFVEFVLGAHDPVSVEMGDLLNTALDPPGDFGAQSWLDFGYF